jgi:hypothetical protein
MRTSTEKKLSIHWHKHDQMTPDQFRLINWEACEQAMPCLKISRRHWVAKHTEGMCGVNKWLFKWKDRDTDECPRCSLPEDARHVCQCLAGNTHPIRAAGMVQLDNWMQSSLTSPDIRLVINTRLQQLFHRLPRAPFPTLSILAGKISSRDVSLKNGRQSNQHTIDGANLESRADVGWFP